MAALIRRLASGQGLAPASLLLGLLLVVPLLGFASWHAYRDAVDAQGLPERGSGSGAS